MSTSSMIPRETINQTELFMKYKSSYKSAFVDLTFHCMLIYSSYYLLWYFRNSWLSIFTIPLFGLLNVKNVYHFS